MLFFLHVSVVMLPFSALVIVRPVTRGDALEMFLLLLVKFVDKVLKNGLHLRKLAPLVSERWLWGWCLLYLDLSVTVAI